MKRPKKATHRTINKDFLAHRIQYLEHLGYKKTKWIEFCEHMLAQGYTVTLYEARQTRSKYVSVHGKTGGFYRVRFSDHAAIVHREAAGDCDFFVGRGNFRTTTTTDAIRATLAYFNLGRNTHEKTNCQ